MYTVIHITLTLEINDEKIIFKLTDLLIKKVKGLQFQLPIEFREWNWVLKKLKKLQMQFKQLAHALDLALAEFLFLQPSCTPPHPGLNPW